ncbi:MAG: hypothetical protein AMJ68_03935 [Acidithiobacillales bacterium SG8_45]|jgi:hypothetical protein|nr:MAG: hypothetical protein AMJ68_03935 [Acidithiobacillales bacterium SG8_45]
MQKFAFVDESGTTPDNIRLEPGKYVADATEGNELLMKMVHAAGDTPQFAALVNSADSPMKLYSVEQWAVDPKSSDGKCYMVVKEVEAPVVRLEQKMNFAIAAMGNLYDNEEFKAWASNWVSKSDRSAETALRMNAIAKEEMDGIQALVDMGIHTGGSHEEMAQQKDMFARVDAVTRAAALSIDPSKSDKEVVELVSQALDNIQRFSDKTNLADLANLICND